jgi:hypothetical protein
MGWGDACSGVGVRQVRLWGGRVRGEGGGWGRGEGGRGEFYKVVTGGGEGASVEQYTLLGGMGCVSKQVELGR